MNKGLVQTACVVSLALVVFAVPGMSKEKQAGGSAHKILHSGDLKWTPIIKGCEIAVVEGNLDAEASLSSRAFIARTGLRLLRIGTRPMRTSLFLGAYFSSERANRSTSQNYKQ
jgi:hypothetical protein